MMRAAVVGVGAMGQHHARVYNDLDGVELVAVADTDPTRAELVGRRLRVPAYVSLEEMIERERPDLVSIAVPTVAHHRVARAVIERDVHLLVEKPIAVTLEEAWDLITLASARGVHLAVGHIERFNAAVIELKRRLSSGELGEIYQIHARRLSAFPRHVRDVGVIMDLATHELDIMRYLLDDDVEYLFAQASRRIHAHHEDMLSCIIQFANGTVGVLDINWLTPTKVRELRVTCALGMFVADYLLQDLYFFENSFQPSQWDALALLKGGVEEGNMLKLRVSKVEPLRAELKDFIDAVASGRPPSVTGLDGLQTLALAQAVLTSAQQRRVVSLPRRDSPLPVP